MERRGKLVEPPADHGLFRMPEHKTAPRGFDWRFRMPVASADAPRLVADSTGQRSPARVLAVGERKAIREALAAPAGAPATEFSYAGGIVTAIYGQRRLVVTVREGSLVAAVNGRHTIDMGGASALVNGTMMVPPGLAEAVRTMDRAQPDGFRLAAVRDAAQLLAAWRGDALQAMAWSAPPEAEAMRDEMPAPSMGWSCVPVLGSGQMALHQASVGQYGRAAFWMGMTWLDVALLSSLGRSAITTGMGVTQGARAAASAEVEAIVSRNVRSLDHGLRHYTNVAGMAGVSSSGRIGSTWGVFALDATSEHIPRWYETIVKGPVPFSVPIVGEAVGTFRSPPLTGVVAGMRRSIGIYSTPLGAVDITAGQFVPGLILKHGAFREATVVEYAAQLSHQWFLDYGIDGVANVFVKSILTGVEYLYEPTSRF